VTTVIPIHARVSSNARLAANAASVSAVRPARCAVFVFRMGNHHSGGIESRCGHLRAAETPAPISAANASGVDQRETTSRKLETMPTSLGQSVLKIKPAVSHDSAKRVGHTVSMAPDAEKLAETQWRKEFAARLKEARGPRTQVVMAELLGITQTAYSKYEGARKTMMPVRLLPRFCKICGRSLEWLIEGPAKETKMPQPKAKRRAA
jgi:hypothetical protein